MEANTTYEGYRKNDQVIRWFWKAVHSFTQEEKAKLVQFITGTSKVRLTIFFVVLYVFFLGPCRRV
jgi:E3 ubiquitin-protein ligase HUWE1